MNRDYTPRLVSLAARFYSRALRYPYDELTHEFQHLFREMEKYISTHIDNTITTRVLDVLNFYQGEEMRDLQAEFTRLFTPVENQEPLVSRYLSDFSVSMDSNDLQDRLYESALMLDVEEAPDSVCNVLDYFSALVEEAPEEAEEVYEAFLKKSIPAFNENMFNGTTLNFYKELAKGLNELIILLDG